MSEGIWQYVILGPPGEDGKRKTVLFGYNPFEREYVAEPDYRAGLVQKEYEDFRSFYAKFPQALEAVEGALERAVKGVATKAKTKPTQKPKTEERIEEFTFVHIKRTV